MPTRVSRSPFIDSGSPPAGEALGRRRPVATGLVALLLVTVALTVATYGSRSGGTRAPAAPPPAAVPVVVPVSAGAFRDSVGVNVHVAFHDTAYVGWPLLVSRLQSLGVVHVRDGAYGNPAPQWRQFNADYVNAVALAASHGIRFDFMVGQPGFQGGTLDQLLAALRGPLRNAAEALEAPNEFDHFVGGPNWPSVLTRYDKELYAKAKADPSLRSLPVIGPALVGANATRTLGNQQAWLDIGNVHPYTGGQSPGPDHSNSELARARVLSGPKPIWATEAGFFNAPNATLRQSVPETTAAIYLLRTFLEHFKSGISRTYAYELIDDKPDPTATDPQQHFGLLRNDYTPKPAFTALQNLLALVGPTQGNTTLQPLRLTTSGPNDLRQLVLQRPDGSYLIVLWRLASIWNPAQQHPQPITTQQTTITLPPDTTATIADPINTATSTPLPLNHGQAHINIAADPLILTTTPPQHPTGAAARQ